MGPAIGSGLGRTSPSEKRRDERRTVPSASSITVRSARSLSHGGAARQLWGSCGAAGCFGAARLFFARHNYRQRKHRPPIYETDSIWGEYEPSIATEQKTWLTW
jgi:hypothetical protein